MSRNTRLLHCCEMAEVSMIDLVPTDFKGAICQTGNNCEPSIIKSLRDFPPKKNLDYYVQSLPSATGKHTGGKVSCNDPLIIEFQRACDEWTKYTQITFRRTTNKAEADFMIRSANLSEEKEKSKKLVADAFFWSDDDEIKVLKIWKKISEWSAYSVFLHEIGHILGFRHEHAFLSQHDRGLLGSVESSRSYKLLQEVVDKYSIMSYGYLRQFVLVSGKGEAELSAVDRDEAIKLYEIFQKELDENPKPLILDESGSDEDQNQKKKLRETTSRISFQHYYPPYKTYDGRRIEEINQDRFNDASVVNSKKRAHDNDLVSDKRKLKCDDSVALTEDLEKV